MAHEVRTELTRIQLVRSDSGTLYEFLGVPPGGSHAVSEGNGQRDAAREGAGKGPGNENREAPKPEGGKERQQHGSQAQSGTPKARSKGSAGKAGNHGNPGKARTGK